METVYFIIPAYNEADNINGCIDDWYPVVEKLASSPSVTAKLVIVNDGSKDNTFQLLNDATLDHPLLVPLTKPNGGHGPTVLFGYHYAIENGADYIFQTDSDRQTNPDEFPAFWELRDKYDAIIGNRIERGDGKSRKFVENTVCLILRLVFGVKLSDANAPFRLMRCSLVNKYIELLPRDYNLPNIMFSTFFAYFNENICFLPITFKPRLKGTNSINIKKIIKIGIIAIKDFLLLKGKMNGYKENC